MSESRKFFPSVYSSCTFDEMQNDEEKKNEKIKKKTNGKRRIKV